jgi:hypothetical protein
MCKHPVELLQSNNYLIDLCNNGKLEHFSDIVTKTILKHPKVTFAFIQAKKDIVQWSYYNIQVKSIGTVIYIYIILFLSMTNRYRFNVHAFKQIPTQFRSHDQNFTVEQLQSYRIT